MLSSPFGAENPMYYVQILHRYGRCRCVQSFEHGDYIIRQGEEGTRFFIINEGEASEIIKFCMGTRDRAKSISPWDARTEDDYLRV